MDVSRPADHEEIQVVQLGFAGVRDRDDVDEEGAGQALGDRFGNFSGVPVHGFVDDDGTHTRSPSLTVYRMSSIASADDSRPTTTVGPLRPRSNEWLTDPNSMRVIP